MSLGHGAFASSASGHEPVALPFTQAPTAGDGVQMFAGKFALNNTAGSQNISGLGFQPKAVIFWGMHQYTVDGGNELQRFYGVATSAADQWNAVSETNTLNNYNDHRFDNAGCIQFIYGPAAGGGIAYASLQGMTSDGFTIFVEFNNPTEVRYVYFLAIGGPGVSAKAGSFNTGTTTGNQAVTGIGFQPKANIFSCGAKDTTMNGGPDVRMNFGWAVSNTKQAAQAMRSIDGALGANSNVHSIQLTDSCVLMMTDTVVDEKASFVSNDSDGFTLNWTTKSATAFKVGYLALGGTARYDCGTLTEPASTGSQSVTGLSMKPIGTIFMTNGVAASTAVQAGARQSLGAAVIATNVTAVGSWIANASQSAALPVSQVAPSAAIFTQGNTQAVTRNSATLLTNDANGFTLNWTTVDANSVQVAFLSIGSPSATANNKTMTATSGSTAKVKNRKVKLNRLLTSPSVPSAKKAARTKKKVTVTSTIKLLKQSASVGISTLKAVAGSATSMIRGKTRVMKAVAGSAKSLFKRLAKSAATKATATNAAKLIKLNAGKGVILTATSATVAKQPRKTQKAFLLQSPMLPDMKKAGVRSLAALAGHVVSAPAKKLFSKNKATSGSTIDLHRSRAMVFHVAPSNSTKMKSAFAVKKTVESLSQSYMQKPRLLYKQQVGISNTIPYLIRKIGYKRTAIAGSLPVIGTLSVSMRKIIAVATSVATVSAAKYIARTIKAISPVTGVITRKITQTVLAYSSNIPYIYRKIVHLPIAVASPVLPSLRKAFVMPKMLVAASALATMIRGQLLVRSIAASAGSVLKFVRFISSTINLSASNTANIKNKAITFGLTAQIGNKATAPKSVSRAVKATATSVLNILLMRTHSVKAVASTAASFVRFVDLAKKAAVASASANTGYKKYWAVTLSVTSSVISGIARLFTSGNLPVANAQHTITLRRRIRTITPNLRDRA